MRNCAILHPLHLELETAQALIQPIKQAKATVASPTLMGYSDIMAMPTVKGIAMDPAISPAAISRPA